MMMIVEYSNKIGYVYWWFYMYESVYSIIPKKKKQCSAIILRTIPIPINLVFDLERK